VNRCCATRVVAVAAFLASCAGSASERTCEQALEHTASLAVARSESGEGSRHSDAHQAALMRATGDRFLSLCRERSAGARAALIDCVLATDNLAAARGCWSR
jgi:hypothetical protein